METVYHGIKDPAFAMVFISGLSELDLVHECKMLKNLHRQIDYLLVPYNFSGPSVIFQGHFFVCCGRKN
jgi:hypothetical protein